MPKNNSINEKFIYDNSDVTSNSKQLAILKQNFPNCFDKDGNFISHKMEEIVGSAGLELSKESYSLNWLGKSYARLLANENPQTLLKEDKVHNAKEANHSSENLLIKGDNLEVLKHLSHAYSESIKMIYIDPPYNTGGDGFVYDDDRKFSVDELQRLAGVERDEAKRILEFTASKANSHSAWLTFMYPRLYVARELLREDGVIFISIDDNEVAQLKLLCDEVFGEENFVGNFLWEKRINRENRKVISIRHDYILCYTKNISSVTRAIGLLPMNDEAKKRYNNPDNDSRGIWTSVPAIAQGGHGTKNQFYKLTTPSGREINPPSGSCWRYTETKMKEAILDNRIWFGSDGKGVPRIKKFITEGQQGLTPESIWWAKEVGTNDSAKRELVKLFNDLSVFETPKPYSLIERMLYLSTDKSSLILDFFAGSGTTAHAVMALNAEDGGNRKFITVQIPEKTDEKSEAYKAGYKTIFDITKARIEKASEQLNDKSGFKIFETTPMFEGYLDELEELNANSTLFNGKNLNSEEIETLLTTWKVHDGMLLTDSLELVMLGEYGAKYGVNTLYFMNDGFNMDALEAFIAKLDNDKAFEPSKLVVFGYNFDSKHQRELKEALNNYKNKKSIELEMMVRY